MVGMPIHIPLVVGSAFIHLPAELFASPYQAGIRDTPLPVPSLSFRANYWHVLVHLSTVTCTSI
jgi:hypothetical protein